MAEFNKYPMLAENSLCTGCSACAMICHQRAITMHEDSEGFYRPLVDGKKCLNCGICSKICPVMKQSETSSSPVAFAARSLDDNLRRSSSSGGIFYLLGEKVIQEKGVVFGCALTGPDFIARHVYAETYEELSTLKGSKYVQSDLGECFVTVKNYLSKGRKVLFSGTPCQVMGLKSYLGIEYENLITVTFICHGVPSPDVYKKYIQEIKGKSGEIESVSFRDKTFSWRKFSMALRTKDGRLIIRDTSHDPFLRVFLANLCLRPSCYQCPCQKGRSEADITLADFWAVKQFTPELDDNRGTSYLLVHTDNGSKLWESCFSLVKRCVVPFEETIQYNRAYFESPSEPASRSKFMRLFRKTSLTKLGDYLIEGPWYKRYPRRMYYYCRTQAGKFLRRIGVR